MPRSRQKEGKRARAVLLARAAAEHNIQDHHFSLGGRGRACPGKEASLRNKKAGKTINTIQAKENRVIRKNVTVQHSTKEKRIKRHTWNTGKNTVGQKTRTSHDVRSTVGEKEGRELQRPFRVGEEKKARGRSL